jgi:hypothetical protein
MDTPWWVNGVGQEAADKLREVVKGSVPLRVASKPEDIAEVVTFLASPASRHMTGSIVPADAGVRLLVPVAPTDEFMSPSQPPPAVPLPGHAVWAAHLGAPAFAFS